jgi:hypothetical protein
MEWGDWFQFFAASMSRDRIDHWTLWVLAAGVLIAVVLHVAKWIVRDFKELQQEIHRPTSTQVQHDGSPEQGL